MSLNVVPLPPIGKPVPPEECDFVETMKLAQTGQMPSRLKPIACCLRPTPPPSTGPSPCPAPPSVPPPSFERFNRPGVGLKVAKRLG